MPDEDVYRACASVVVFRRARPSDDGYEILLVHNPRKKDDWQLPQGGVEEGEKIEEAALRELKEEAGIEAKLIRKSGDVYQYNFPASYRRFRPDNVCGQRIEYVFATVGENQQVQVDGEEVDKFVWVRPDGLNRYIKRKAYLEVVEKLARSGITLLRSM